MDVPTSSFEEFARRLPYDTTVAAAFHMWNQSRRLPLDVVKALDEGNVILAIKMYRDHMPGVRPSLAEAKQAIDAAIADSVKWQVARAEFRRARGWTD